MLHRLEIRDFQSLSEVSLELGQLVVIIGSTNSGKSAVVRALQAALFNRSGGEFVREGKDATEVKLVFEGGPLTWRKPRKGGGEYRMNGTPLTRVGREAPPELDKLTGVREIVGEGVKARLNFDDQFSEPFLLAGTGGQAARLLARVSKLDVLVTAQVLARRDGERTKKAATAADELAQGLRDRLAAQPDYEQLLRRWEALRERNEVLQAEEAKLVAADGLLVELQRLQRTRAVWVEKRLPERVAALVEQVSVVADAAKTVATLAEATAGVEGAKTRRDSAEMRLAEVEEELHQRLAGLEICPVCGRPM